MIEKDRLCERAGDGISQFRRALRVNAPGNDGKLVVLKTPEHRTRRQSSLETFRDAHEHGIAADATQRIVEIAKAVDVDQRENQDIVAAAFNHRFQQHHGPVGQFGEAIPGRQPAHCLDMTCERAASRRVARSATNAQSVRMTSAVPIIAHSQFIVRK